MKNFKKALVIILSAMILAIPVIQATEAKADEIPLEDLSFTPTVFGQITSETEKIVVYSYGDEHVPVTLKVSNGKETIFKKTYKTLAIRVIEIPRQKAGTCLQFTLKTSYGRKGETVKKIVKDAGTVSKKKVSSSLTSPKVSGKVTDKSTSVKVYAKKGTTVYVKHGSTLLAKKKYKKSGYQTLPIKKQKAGEVITFYVENNERRSKYVEKVVSDATVPSKPKVKVVDDDIKVTGEIGTGVYIKDITDGEDSGWVFMGALEKKTELFFPISYYMQGHDYTWDRSHELTYQVRLKDAWGNKSKTVTVTFPKEEGLVSVAQ